MILLALLLIFLTSTSPIFVTIFIILMLLMFVGKAILLVISRMSIRISLVERKENANFLTFNIALEKKDVWQLRKFLMVGAKWEQSISTALLNFGMI